MSQVNPFLDVGAAPGPTGAPIVREAVTIDGQATVVQNPAAQVQPQQQQFVQPTAQPVAQPVHQPIQNQVSTNVGQNPVVMGAANGGSPVLFNQQPTTNAPVEISIEDDVQINQLEKLPKMRKDEVMRICFLSRSAKGSVGFHQSLAFWIEEKRLGFLAPQSNLELMKKLIEAYGEPKMRFVTVVGKYDTDDLGNIRSPNMKLFAYVCGTDKFPTIKALNAQWDLKSRDVLITCAEPTYQKQTFMPAPEMMLASAPAFFAETQQKAQFLFNTAAAFYCGRKMTDAQIMEKAFGIVGAGGAAAAGQGVAGYNPFAAQQAAGGAAPGVGTNPGGATTDFAHLVSQSTQNIPVG